MLAADDFLNQSHGCLHQVGGESFSFTNQVATSPMNVAQRRQKGRGDVKPNILEGILLLNILHHIHVGKRGRSLHSHWKDRRWDITTGW